jgi:hypothetical protein
MRYLLRPLPLIAMISFLFILFQWRTIAHTPGPGTDFSIYYHAAGAFNNPSSTLYSSSTSSTTSFDQYLYPPPCILIFRLFHLFPEKTSFLLFTVTMYICLIAALLIALSLSNIRPDKIFPLLLFALASAPVYHQLSLGQINSLVLLLSMLHLRLLQKNTVLSGILLAIAVWIKVYPILLAIPALLSFHGRKAILSSILAGIGLPLLCQPWIPLRLYADFARTLGSLSNYTSAHIINQSLTAFGIRARLPFERAFQWPNIYLVPAWLRFVNFILLLSTLLLATVKAWKQRSNQASFIPGFLLLAASAVFSPLGWGHTFVLCLPLWIVSLEKIESFSRTHLVGYGLFMLIAVLLLIPVYNHPAFMDHWPALIRTFYYSRFLFITLFLILFLGNPFAKDNLTSD